MPAGWRHLRSNAAGEGGPSGVSPATRAHGHGWPEASHRDEHQPALTPARRPRQPFGRGRLRHPAVEFRYARDLGIHPAPLAVAEERIRQTVDGDASTWAVVIVSRGSSDPDANADLYKVARLLWDGRGLSMVEPAFVSLAAPSVPDALDRCYRLGARKIAVVPYFLFTGVLVDRIHEQAKAWAEQNGIEVRIGPELGPDPRLARLVLERYHEAIEGDVRMNCDCCKYRVALPGYHQH